MIASSDADIRIFTGDDCIVLKELTRDGSMELVCISEATLRHALSFLSDEDREQITFHTAEHSSISNLEAPDRPNYKKIWSLVKAADCVIDDCNFVGSQLLSLRANKKSKERTRNSSKSQLANLQVKQKKDSCVRT